MSLCVVNQELERAPGVVAAARFVAAATAVFVVTSPLASWKTTTFGGRTPVPKVCSVFWLVSYADFPGIEKLWYQRFETFPAAKPPKRVRTIHTEITSQRCR